MGELVAAGAGEMEAVAAPDRAVTEQAALEQEVQLLDEVLVVWRARALDGDPVAVDKMLELQKQRLVLLQLWPAGGAGMRVSAGATSRGDEREVRVVVEYVDDWRQAGRRSVEQG